MRDMTCQCSGSLLFEGLGHLKKQLVVSKKKLVLTGTKAAPLRNNSCTFQGGNSLKEQWLFLQRTSCFLKKKLVVL